MISIMDTTLRDGEQMRNVSYSPEEKLNIAKTLLTEVKVDFIEVANARVSRGEAEAVRRILDWANEAGYADRIETLGFIDKTQSVDWIADQGGRVMNLLCKGSLNHLSVQLKKTKEEHIREIKETLDYAESRGVMCNLYLEDWSNGMIHSPDYVDYLIGNLKETSIRRFMLPDTLGILFPEQAGDFCETLLQRFPEVRFDFHAHNDYGVAVANTIAAISRGIDCVHVTVNGMGERAGNTPLDEVVVGVHDHLGLATHVDEKALFKISQKVEIYSGCRLPFNKPITGHNVFTQTAGIHADGDKKGGLYATRLMPERFDRQRQYALGKMSGKSSLEYNLQRLGIDLSEDQKQKVLRRIVELGDRKASITDDDLPYIVADVLETPEKKTFALDSCFIVTAIGLKPVATVKMLYFDPEKPEPVELEVNASGDGGYDAFMNAVMRMTQKIDFKLPRLADYAVTIPPGGKTDALVQCAIHWEETSGRFITKGVNSDQVLAAIEATMKMLNLIALKNHMNK